MPVEASSDNPQNTLIVTCEETIDIKLAGELHGRLREALEQGLKVEINARRVERVDAAILQIIFAYFKAARARSLDVRITGVSENFAKASQLLGMTEALGISV